jgi:hypothetical protein
VGFIWAARVPIRRADALETLGKPRREAIRRSYGTYPAEVAFLPLAKHVLSGALVGRIETGTVRNSVSARTACQRTVIETQ